MTWKGGKSYQSSSGNIGLRNFKAKRATKLPAKENPADEEQDIPAENTGTCT